MTYPLLDSIGQKKRKTYEILPTGSAYTSVTDWIEEYLLVRIKPICIGAAVSKLHPILVSK